MRADKAVGGSGKLTKGVIFDLDGTLLDTTKEWDELPKNYLINKGKTPEENINKILGGMSLEESAKYFIEYYNVNLSIKEIVDEINSLIADKYLNHFQLKGSVVPYLNRLKSENIRMCIATATEPSLVIAALNRLKVNNYFEFVLTCDDIGYSKSYPNLYEECIKRLGLDKDEVVVYEDTIECIKTVKNAGIKVIGIYHSLEHRNEMEQLTEKCIAGFSDLL